LQIHNLKEILMSNVRIHPSAFLGEGVSLGDNVVVGPNAVLLGPLEVGDRVWIGPGAVIGAPPEISSLEQNSAWEGELQYEGVLIEHDAVIRELTTIGQGSHRTTRIGAHSWLMNNSYVAHDVVMGNRVTISAGTKIGGHANIGSRSTFGLNSSVHQHRSIGPGAIIGMGTAVTRDVLPFSKVFGQPPRRHGINLHLLRNLKIDADVVDAFIANNETFSDFSAHSADPILGPLLAEWDALGVDPELTVRSA